MTWVDPRPVVSAGGVVDGETACRGLMQKLVVEALSLLGEAGDAKGDTVMALSELGPGGGLGRSDLGIFALGSSHRLRSMTGRRFPNKSILE